MYELCYLCTFLAEMKKMELNNYAAYESRLTDYLESNGLRKTPERFAVLKHIVSFSKHFTAEQLYDLLEANSYHVSRATVYNTLELLTRAQLVRRHAFDGVLVQYEKVGVSRHCHLVCRHCGKVKEARDPHMIAFMNTRKFAAFSADYYSLTFYGICSTCARRLKRSAKRR